MTEEITNPEPINPQPDKKKRRKWPWITLGIIIILPILAVGISGIYYIPLVSDVFGARKPKDLGIKTSPEALASALADNPMELKGSPTEYYGLGKKIFTGQVNIDDQHSSEEVTSFIELYTQDAPFISDLQVKFTEGGMELSAFIKKFIKAPVYVKIGVTRTSEKTIDIDLQKAKVGVFSVPEQYYDEIEKSAEEFIASRIEEIGSFSIEQLQYHDGYVYFKGTLPETVEMIKDSDDYSIL
ncbi:MAG: hypothetical protein V1853_00825 [bacterium]